MVLHQTDGTLDLTKTDKKTGEIIGDDEGEGQTSFYLWKYETNKKTGEKDTMYCTYVEPTYTTNKDGEQVLEKDGFYCWVKYDPTKDKLTAISPSRFTASAKAAQVASSSFRPEDSSALK